MYLEDITDKSKQTANMSIDEGSFVKIFEKLLDTQKNNHQSIAQLAEQFTIEKFSNRSTNAFQWISSFEKECDRLLISDEKAKISIL